MSTTLSKKQLAKLLLQGGFTEQQVPAMLEIARRESSLNPLALNPNADTGDLSYGLFQINMLGGMGPERRKALGLKSNEELYDPATNVRAAKYIYDMQGPQAWSVYDATDPAFTNLNFNDDTSSRQGNTYNINVEAPKEKPKQKKDPFELLLLGQFFNNPTGTTGHPFQQMLGAIQRQGQGPGTVFKHIQDQGNKLAANLLKQYQSFSGFN